MYYKLGQTCVTNWGSFVLLQIRANVVTNWGSFIIANGASVITNWGSYYKLGQPLLQNRAAITNWGRIYNKFRQVLQIGAIITSWGIPAITSICCHFHIFKPIVVFYWNSLIQKEVWAIMTSSE